MLFGKDIYWYGIQAISIIENGTLHSNDISPVFYIVSYIFRFIGINETALLIFQISTAIWLVFSIAIARKFYFQKIYNSKIFLPSFSILLVAFLYPKQGWSLGFLIIGIGFYYSGRPVIRIIGTVLFFGLSVWFHVMVGLIGLAIFVIYFIPKNLYPLLLIFILIFSYILPENSDTRFYKGEDGIPIIAAFGLAGAGIIWEWIFILIINQSNKDQIKRSLSFIGLLLLIPLLHFADIQFRFLLSLIIISQIFFPFSKLNILVWLIGSFLWINTVLTRPDLFRYSYEEFNFPAEKISHIPDSGLLIAHHGFCEFYHFHFRKDCLSWKPDDKANAELPHGKKIYRAIYGIRLENLQASKDEEKNLIFSYIEPFGNYLLVTEEEWDRYLMILEKRNSKYLTIAKSWRNPYRKRPDFINRKHTYGF